jgi:hypothetical protein
MKSPVKRLTDEELEAYPIKDRLEGWFFRIQEVSNGIYEIEGTDVWGRKVSRKTIEADLEEVLKVCANDARKIQAELDQK